MPTLGTTPTKADTTKPTAPVWQDIVLDAVLSYYKSAAKKAGLSTYAAEIFVQTNSGALFSYLARNYIGKGGAELDLSTPIGSRALVNAAIAYLGTRPGAQSLFAAGQSTGSGSGSGSGYGGAGLTAAAFDATQLANRASEIWQSYLWDEPPDARGLAKEYINARLANPEAQLDFDTFVRSKAEATTRWKVLFKNKPAGQDARDYLQGYIQTATSVLGGNNGQQGGVNQAVVAGAALGATPEAFRGLLQNQRSQQIGAPYINRIEERVRGVAGVLRG
jgi:hypothetical protein